MNLRLRNSVFELSCRIWRHIVPRRQIQLVGLLLLMIVASLFEILNIGAIMPFLGVLTAPERVFRNELFQPALNYFHIETQQRLLLFLTLAFGVSTVLTATVRFLLSWASIRISFAMGAEFGIKIYSNVIYQPYCEHVSSNSSEVIAGVTNKASNIVHGYLLPILTLASSFFMFFGVASALLFIDPRVAVYSVVGFGLIYFIIVRSTRLRMEIESKTLNSQSARVLQILQESLGGIRDILLGWMQPIYLKVFNESFKSQQRAYATVAVISIFPRFGVEALGLLTIAAIAYFLATNGGGIQDTVPILGALALGAQRLLPIMQQSYTSITSLRAYQDSVFDAIKMLDLKASVASDSNALCPLPFFKDIRLDNLYFSHKVGGVMILKGIKLIIPKGSRIGIIGQTGGGKSTLLDVLMGLLPPTKGHILIDNKKLCPSNIRDWQSKIAHVPQTIFLSDASVAENIAFGIPKDKVDLEKVKIAARKAQIADSIESWVDGYETRVGERGVLLSGGQRQRIGIARALYRSADVIIFDEATSALDSDTEMAVIDAIEKLGKSITIIAIAHRLSTLKKCDQIFELTDGEIRAVNLDPIFKVL